MSQFDLLARVQAQAQRLAILRKKEVGQMDFGNCVLCSGPEHAGPCNKPIVLQKSEGKMPEAGKNAAAGRDAGSGGQVKKAPKLGKEEMGANAANGAGAVVKGKEMDHFQAMNAALHGAKPGGTPADYHERMNAALHNSSKRPPGQPTDHPKSGAEAQQMWEDAMRQSGTKKDEVSPTSGNCKTCKGAKSMKGVICKSCDGTGKMRKVAMSKAEAAQASAHHLNGLNKALARGDNDSAAKHARLCSIYERLMGGDPQKGFLPETEALAGRLAKGEAPVAFKAHRFDEEAERLWKATPGAMLGMMHSTPPVKPPAGAGGTPPTGKPAKPAAPAGAAPGKPPGSALASLHTKVFGAGKTAAAAPSSAGAPNASPKPTAPATPAAPAGGAGKPPSTAPKGGSPKK